MTISYSLECSTTGLATFFKLLVRWRGSIYKVLYKEMIAYTILYFILSFVYRFALNDYQQTVFEKIAMFCENYTSFVPLTFVLSFYISTVVSRWWNIFEAMAWIDRVGLHLSCYVHGCDEQAKLIRRTIVRYLNAAQVLVLRDISSAAKKRFPTLEHVVNAGFVTENELTNYMDNTDKLHRYWIPIQWCCSLLSKARLEEFIDSDFLLHKITNEVLLYRDNLHTLLNYDWVSIPLVYTQVVTLAVYSFFLACLMGRQYLNPSKDYKNYNIDLYVPIFTLLQFLFYVGWLKVAETLINPLGEDDDDFEVNYIVERNLQVGYVMVDENFNKLPPLERDIHWNELEPEIPYTAASVGLKTSPQIGSADAVQIKPEETELAPETCEIEESVGRRLSRALHDRSRSIVELFHTIKHSSSHVEQPNLVSADHINASIILPNGIAVQDGVDKIKRREYLQESDKPETISSADHLVPQILISSPDGSETVERKNDSIAEIDIKRF